MEGGVSGFPGMIVLNSHNFSNQKIKIEDLLIVKDLYESIDRSEMQQCVDVATIKQCVDVSGLQHVANDTNTYEM